MDCLKNLAYACREVDSPIRGRCFEIMANMTKFPGNGPKLATCSEAIEALSEGATSQNDDDRIWALRSLQNITADAPNKVEIATASFLEIISNCAVRLEIEDEQDAAISILLNLSTEPGTIVQFTSSKSFISSLVQIVNNDDYDPDIQFMACDILCTISMWLQNLSAGGSIPVGVTGLALPSHVSTGHMRW